MAVLEKFITSTQHALLVEEYRALESSEDRLTWLMERNPEHEPVPIDLLTPDRRVPGCLSGLWLHASNREGLLYFSAKSESAIVQGVVSFLCDLYSGRDTRGVITISDSIASELGIQRLLSTTRQRAVSSAVSFFIATARDSSGSLVYAQP